MQKCSRLCIGAALLALATLVVACNGGASSSDSTPASPPAGTQTAEAPPTPVLTPSTETKRYLGETIAFTFPDNWYIVKRSYESEVETVILANIERDVAAKDLPEGAIKIEFTGTPRAGQGPKLEDVKETRAISGVRFSLREGDDVPWQIIGSFVIGGINFRYTADVRMNTDEPQLDQLTPLLESWVVGSTNNHPARPCISPIECP